MNAVKHSSGMAYLDLKQSFVLANYVLETNGMMITKYSLPRRTMTIMTGAVPSLKSKVREKLKKKLHHN